MALIEAGDASLNAVPLPFDPRFCAVHLEFPCLNFECPLSHDTDLKYLWLVKHPTGATWFVLAPHLQETIENNFMNPKNSHFKLRFDNVEHIIDFNNLCQKQRIFNVDQIPQISDPFDALQVSSVRHRRVTSIPVGFQNVRLGYASVFDVKVRWNWYYMADDQVKPAVSRNSIRMYFKPILDQLFPGNGRAVSDFDASGPNLHPWKLFDTAKIEVLEAAYESELTSVELEITGNRYLVDFVSMTQKNLSTKKSRQVRRRPVPIEQYVECPSNEFYVPEFSLEMPSLFRSKSEFNEVVLSSKDFEYKLIVNAIEKQLTGSSNISITRIENCKLWAHYCLQRASLLRKYGSLHKLNESLLFHGTSKESAEKIGKENFDWRLAGSHVGQRYGAGVYFTPDLTLAQSYCRRGCSEKYLLIGLLLVGDFTLGSNGIKRPPPRKDNPEDLYDSCVDDLFRPRIFVIFDHNQMYPLYRVKFTL